jgi:hypothetical protein
MSEKKITIKNEDKGGMSKLLNPIKPARERPGLEEILKEIEEAEIDETVDLVGK